MSNWVEEDGAHEIGSPEWKAWSDWSDELAAAMTALGFRWGPHFLIDDKTKFLPQECEICRHCTEIKEQMIGQRWEQTEVEI